jgi:hypothetical protein
MACFLFFCGCGADACKMAQFCRKLDQARFSIDWLVGWRIGVERVEQAVALQGKAERFNFAGFGWTKKISGAHPAQEIGARHAGARRQRVWRMAKQKAEPGFAQGTLGQAR